MQIEQICKKTAITIETNNLRGGDDVELVTRSLNRLIEHLQSQTIGLHQLAQVVITHDGLPKETCQSIEQLAGYKIDFVQIEDSTGYYEAKNIGFDATNKDNCDYVVFADSDCIPDKHWLEQILLPFSKHPETSVVAGRTSYPANLVGTALTTLDFMYFRNALGANTTSNFYANNVVFRRDVFERYRYQTISGMYRGHCQVMGMHLINDGVPIIYTALAHTQHRLPDTRRQALKLRWIRGQDSVELTPHIIHTHIHRRWRWLARSGPIGPLCVMFGRLGYSLKALNRQDMPMVKGVRRLTAYGFIIGFSLVDTLGAFARSIGINTVGRAAADAKSLSYHGQ
ncbi:Glucosyl-3-phosphoglycerate synthase [hydrothermal vent metagenome]|uniref:Glucosyl-3-phosphoglycerate synthase n=1 Tax=hydrothermal vent metagenome TaxID=652676 RepID=A0A3B0Z9R9_9ZZZZ